MSGRTKPRRHKPGPIAINPVAIAISRASAFTPAELAQLLAPARAGLQAMRQGKACEEDWIHLVTAAATGLAIERKGVVTGLQEVLTEADQTLFTICHRATSSGSAPWRAPTLYAAEINTLDTLVQVHSFQLGQLSYGEYKTAQAYAVAQVRQAKGRVIQSITVQEVV